MPRSHERSGFASETFLYNYAVHLLRLYFKEYTKSVFTRF